MYTLKSSRAFEARESRSVGARVLEDEEERLNSSEVRKPEGRGKQDEAEERSSRESRSSRVRGRSSNERRPH
eukprot:764996-Hanusia_phi.AAC.3